MVAIGVEWLVDHEHNVVKLETDPRLVQQGSQLVPRADRGMRGLVARRYQRHVCADRRRSCRREYSDDNFIVGVRAPAMR